MRLDSGKQRVQECNLDLKSIVWERLPQSLVEDILAKLPFSSLVRMCSVCKRWRDLILSSENFPRCISGHGHLFFFFKKKLSVFYSQGNWETMPLQFLQQHFMLQYVVASAAGILCFSTIAAGEFIVCNPLTKCYKRVQMLYGEASTISDKPCMPNIIGTNKADRSSLLVGMYIDSNRGHFKLIVADLFQGSGGTTLVYDSHADSWKKVGAVPQGVPHNCCFQWTMQATGAETLVYFYIRTSLTPDRDQLIKYNVVHETWSRILMLECMGIPRNAIEHHGKLILVTASCEYLTNTQATFRAFELEDDGHTSWLEVTNHAPFSKISEVVPNIRATDFVGQGDVVVLVRRNMFLSDHESSTFPAVSFANMMANKHFRKTSVRMFNSDMVESSWEEYDANAYDYFPTGRIYTASTLLLKQGG